MDPVEIEYRDYTADERYLTAIQQLIEKDLSERMFSQTNPFKLLNHYWKRIVFTRIGTFFGIGRSLRAWYFGYPSRQTQS